MKIFVRTLKGKSMRGMDEYSSCKTRVGKEGIELGHPLFSQFTASYIRQSLLLYAVTDSTWLKGRSLKACVAAALAGGATFVQLREKHATTTELVELGRPIKLLCQEAGVPFVINDDVEAACLLDADGVHVGQDDESCARARELLGPHKIVGVSARTIEQACAAEAAGADYLGVGAVFGTSTKSDAVEVSPKGLRAITQAVSLPVVAIGGLNSENIRSLGDSGADGAAVVSALFAADDITQATKRLREECERTFR